LINFWYDDAFLFFFYRSTFWYDVSCPSSSHSESGLSDLADEIKYVLYPLPPSALLVTLMLI
jgi:hypothetical protein